MVQTLQTNSQLLAEVATFSILFLEQRTGKFPSKIHSLHFSSILIFFSQYLYFSNSSLDPRTLYTMHFLFSFVNYAIYHFHYIFKSL